MKKLVLTLAVAFFAMSSAFAQFNVHAGYTMMIVGGDYRTFTNLIGSSNESGISAGVAYAFGRDRALQFSAGVDWSMYGFKKNQESQHMLDVPLLFSYTFDSMSVLPYIFGGPTLQFPLNGSFANDKKLNLLLGPGAGLKFGDHFAFEASYNFGITNFGASDLTARLNTLRVCLKYIM